MSSTIQNRYWKSIPEIRNLAAERAGDAPLVIDIGIGDDPWDRATELVDFLPWPDPKQRKFHTVDIETQPFPFGDQQVDFLYCRHTLEDLINPFLFCSEIKRIAKAGYVETPSPIHEFCRGITDPLCPFRGHIHHRFFIWEESGTLIFLPKYSVVEHLSLGEEQERSLEKTLSLSPWAWNTYFFWEGEFKYKILRHSVDFDLTKNYLDWIARGINQTMDNTQAFIQKHQLQDVKVAPCIQL